MRCGDARLASACWRVVLALALAVCLRRLPGAAAKAAKAVAAAIAPFASSSCRSGRCAQARGVSRETFDRAFAGVVVRPRVVAQTRAQAEFVKPIWDYIASAVSPERIERGQAARRGAAALARQGEARTTASTIASSWASGDWRPISARSTGSDNVIRSLASLAFVHFRGDYFRDELLSALRDSGGQATSKRAQMKGSWAGAMGQTQFMPSSFLEYAVDFEGDGRRDIWTSAPDAIGSTANYLAKHGWIAGAALGLRGRACPKVSTSRTPIPRATRRSAASPSAASGAPTAGDLPSVRRGTTC